MDSRCSPPGICCLARAVAPTRRSGSEPQERNREGGGEALGEESELGTDLG